MALDFTLFASPQLFALLAVAFQLLGLVMRQQVWLRIFLLVGTACYVLYYFTAADSPMWEAIFASSLLALVNMYALGFILLDRSTFRMSADMRALYTHSPTFNPGQFRRIIQHAKWVTAQKDVLICEEGVQPSGLFFLLDGAATIQRAGKNFDLPSMGFIGEMSFLQGPGHPANATVTIHAGSKYVVWNAHLLQRQIERSTPLSNAVMALFNRDLLNKLSRSWPESNESAASVYENLAVQQPRA